MSLNTPTAIEGKIIPAAGTLTKLLTIDSSAAFATLQISATNDSTSQAARIRVAISSSATATAVQRVDYIESGDEVKANGRYTNFGVLLLPGQSVYVQSDNGNVVFRGTALQQLA